MRIAALFAAVATATAAGAFYVASATRADPSAPVAKHGAAPTAEEFARALAGTANQFTAEAQVANPQCVEATPGRYMCSFAVVKGSGRECHIMQGRWTPRAASTITVTLAGRADRCGTLRDALDSLD